MISRSQAAKEIKARIESASEDYDVLIWEKSDKCRLYLKDMGYRNSKAQDQGFLALLPNGKIDWDGVKNNSSMLSAIRNATEGIQFLDMAKMEVGERLAPGQADALAAAPRQRDYRSTTAKALDAIYGRGGWDDRDREDYEG